MQQLLSFHFKIAIIIVLAAVASYLSHFFSAHPLSISATVGVVEFIVIHGLLKSWKLFFFLPTWVKPGWMRVNLNGQWKGQIRSQYKVNPNDQVLSPIDATLEFKQGWRDVVMAIETAQMSSRTNGTTVFYDDELQELQFTYVFKTKPAAAALPDNPAQNYGTGVARVKLAQPNIMKITYTNERGRGGDIEFVKVNA